MKTKDVTTTCYEITLSEEDAARLSRTLDALILSAPAKCVRPSQHEGLRLLFELAAYLNNRTANADVALDYDSLQERLLRRENVLPPVSKAFDQEDHPPTKRKLVEVNYVLDERPLCSNCDGDGFNKDGTCCRTCGGTGHEDEPKEEEKLSWRWPDSIMSRWKSTAPKEEEKLSWRWPDSIMSRWKSTAPKEEEKLEDEDQDDEPGYVPEGPVRLEKGPRHRSFLRIGGVSVGFITRRATVGGTSWDAHVTVGPHRGTMASKSYDLRREAIAWLYQQATDKSRPQS